MPERELPDHPQILARIVEEASDFLIDTNKTFLLFKSEWEAWESGRDNEQSMIESLGRWHKSLRDMPTASRYLSKRMRPFRSPVFTAKKSYDDPLEMLENLGRLIQEMPSIIERFRSLLDAVSGLHSRALEKIESMRSPIPVSEAGWIFVRSKAAILNALNFSKTYHKKLEEMEADGEIVIEKRGRMFAFRCRSSEIHADAMKRAKEQQEKK